MALRYTLTAFEHASLNDALKAEYKLGVNGQYTLDMPGVFVTDKDPSGLMSALENERAQHTATKTHLDRLEAEAKAAKQAADLAKAQAGGDVEALKKLFADQLKQSEETFKKQLEERDAIAAASRKQAAEQMRIAEANKIAADIFGVKAPIMLPHILNSLTIGEGDTPTIQYLGADGKPDLLATPETFKKSFLTNPLFKDMVVISQASGGSANDGKGNVPAARKPDGTARTYDDYKPGELMALKQSNPELFSQLKLAKFPKTS